MTSVHRVSSWAWLIAVFVFAGVGTAADLVELPDPRGGWVPPARAAQPPCCPVAVEVRGVGTFEVDPSQVSTRRPDIFQPGHVSVFDLLVYLSQRGTIALRYRFDPALATHVIESLNGRSGWWYDAHYAGGTFERTGVRMDLYPVKGGMRVRVYLEQPERLSALYESFREEVLRLQGNGGLVRIPQVVIEGPRWSLTFQDVAVTAHKARADVFRPGVVTALDVLLSLGEHGKLAHLRLTWRGGMESYFVDGMTGGDKGVSPVEACTFVHQAASQALLPFLGTHGHAGTHIHLTADLAVVVSPELVKWKWVCLP